MHTPHPSLSAREVLTLQLQALRDDGGTGAGIATAFAFASPGNRRHTGPLARFGAMIRQSYGCMLAARAARVACVLESHNERAPLRGARATFLVAFQTARDKEGGTWLDAMYDAMEEEDEPFPSNGYTGFVWELSRQHDGCYMTDAVGAVPVAQLFPFMAPTAPLPPLGEVPLGQLLHMHCTAVCN